MKINVGSKNITKIEAVKEAFNEFPNFTNSTVVGVEVDSGVHKQPKSIDETVQGAMNRAKSAFNDCDLSVGLESGLIVVPNTKSGYMDITMCAIYDGKVFHLGGSSAFEYPKSMIDLVFSKDYDISEAAKAVGFSHDDNLGEREGMIGVLTKGKLNRQGYSKQAVITALIHLLNPEHY
ncbi:MAG: inosine/xanthosine triphosphatase [Candidatus Paceibacterota bacterium]